MNLKNLLRQELEVNQSIISNKHIAKVLLVIAGFSFQLPAQQIIVSGKVTDSLQTPLEYANIVAVPEIDGQDIKFAVTKNNGTYKLGLVKNQTYEVTISYLGYKTQILKFTAPDKDIVKNVILIENKDELDAVELNYKPPVLIKQDTTVYDVSQFTTGEERKLRDALKKLPGIEVDKAGNVTSLGRKITKVLVEDKTFFTGDSKLAVNNIPADAVDKVEVLDNYTDNIVLKGLEESDDLALNIKLKENKKKFAFGDIEAGLGVEERYIVHPNIFYYSPKTNVNFIGDLNNIGIKSFGFREFIDFEGGFGQLLNNVGSSISPFNSDFSSFLNTQNFTSNVNQFGALNIRQTINDDLDISGYVIASNSRTETAVNTINEFLNISNPFTENRTVTNSLDNFFLLGKLSLAYKPSQKEQFSYNSFVKVTDNASNGLINTINPNQNNDINTLTDVNAFNIKQNINYSLKLSKAHTGSFEALYDFQNDRLITEWLTNQQILEELIPLQDDQNFNILQTIRSESQSFNAILKDYWVLDNFNHLNTSIGINTSFNDFFSEDLQLLSTGGTNNFNDAGFGNDFEYNFTDAFIGLEYKFEIGKTTFRPSIFYHNYFWRTTQFDETDTFSKALVLPQFRSRTEFNNSEKLNFRYRLNARFSSINQLANNFLLSSFNRVFRGDNTLENQLYHTLFLTYTKFSLLRGINFNVSTSYNRRLETLKIVSELDGIESFNTPIIFDQPENNWTINGRLSKKIKKIRLTLNSIFTYNDFFQLINSNTELNISRSITSSIGIRTLFNNLPNVGLNYSKNFNRFVTPNTTSDFENDIFSVDLEYDFLKDFIFKADYTFENFNNINQDISNAFNTANASLFYQKEDSPWGFEINASNIFDVTFRQRSSFNAFLVSDRQIFILPRIITFKLSYKL